VPRRAGAVGASTVAGAVLHLGERDGEGAARARLAVDLDAASALTDDPVDRRQAVARLLRREEGLEDPGPGVRVHPGPGVGHRHPHVGAGADLGMPIGVRPAGFDHGRLDGDPSPVGHRVAGVDHEVHDHLLDLAAVHLDLAEAPARHHHQLHLLADQALQQFGHAGDDLAEIQERRLEHLLPAERQELPGQQRRPLRGLVDALDRAAMRMVGRHGLEQQTAAPQDDGQKVVEIVRDAARKPSDRLHLLELPELDLALVQRPLDAPAVDVSGDV
jgi:hypothetical protein